MTTTRTFDALGFDPAPGDQYLTASSAATARTVASALEEVSNVLAGDGDEPWRGRAAEAFRESMRDELVPRVRDAYESFSTAARALTTWAEALPEFQSRADSLEREAEEARRSLGSAQLRLAGLPTVDDDAYDAAEHEAARRDVNAAETALASIIARAEGLQTEVDQLARATADQLDTAAAIAPDKPGFWESLGNGIVDLAQGINDWFWEEFVPVFEELAPWIGLALAIAAFWVPGLGQIAFALAVAAILIDTGQALRGEGSWGDVILGVAGLAAGMVLGKVLKGFMAMRGNAFQLRINAPPVLAPAGGGAVPVAATAVIKFNPTMFNVGTLGWVTTKFIDLHGSLPEPLKPTPPDLEDDRRRP